VAGSCEHGKGYELLQQLSGLVTSQDELGSMELVICFINYTDYTTGWMIGT
jgi:hypothetical protein